MNGLRSVLVGALAVATLLVPQAARAAETPAPAERIASLKEKLKQNQAALKGYEWIETVVVSFKGEEKSRKQNRCYYGADGALEKVPVGETPEAKTKRGVRGKVAAEKKEEITQYLARSAEAIKQYVPPDPARVQACKDAGKATIAVLEPDKRVRLEFRDYRVPGTCSGSRSTCRPTGSSDSTSRPFSPGRRTLSTSRSSSERWRTEPDIQKEQCSPPRRSA